MSSNSSSLKEITDKELESKSEEVLSNLLDIYLSKFDTLAENIDTAKIAIKAYKERFNKIDLKLNVIKHFFKEKSEINESFFNKIEKLESIDHRLSSIETRTQKLINRIIDAEKSILDKNKKESINLP